MRCNAMQCNVCVCRHVRMYVCDLRSGHSTQKCKLTLAEHSAPSDSHTRFWFKGHLPKKTSTVQKKKGGVVFIRRCPENPPQKNRPDTFAAGRASRSWPMLQPLWLSILKRWPRLSSSVGMMTFPTEWENMFQSTRHVCAYNSIIVFGYVKYI